MGSGSGLTYGYLIPEKRGYSPVLSLRAAVQRVSFYSGKAGKRSPSPHGLLIHAATRGSKETVKKRRNVPYSCVPFLRGDEETVKKKEE